MAGKRRSQISTLIEQVAYAGTPEEKLVAAENALALRITQTRRGSDRRLNFLELDLTPEELKWIDLQVGHAFEPSMNLSAESLTKKYPRLVLASLVGAAMRSDVDNTFWPEWRRRIAVSASQAIESTVRSAISRMLGKAQLKTYDEIDLGANSYTARLGLHAGISAATLEDVVRMHEYRLTEGLVRAGDESESETDFIVAEMSSSPTAPAALRRFIGAENDLARFLIAQVCEFVDYTWDNPDWFTTESFEGTASLPEVMFDELSDFLAHRDDAVSGTEKVYTSPTLHIDEGTGTIQLLLTLPKGKDTVRWTIRSSGERREVVQRSDRSTTDQTNHVLPVTEPSSSIEAQLVETDRLWHFQLFNNDHPIIFFSRSSGRRIGSLREVKAEPVVAVAPKGTTFRNGLGQSIRSIVAPQPVENWNGWTMYTVDFSGADSITVRFSTEVSLNLVLDRRDKLSFSEPDPIHGLQGLDRRPVYASSPAVMIPASEAGEWTRHIFYLHPDGSAEDVYGEPLLCERGEKIKLFESSPDAWVGRFEARLYKDGLFVTSRSYNLAEDIQVKLVFANDNGEVAFRTPRLGRSETGLTTATFEITNTGHKQISLPLGWHKVETNQLSREVEISTPFGYRLKSLVVPPRLTFRIDHVDETSAWRSFPVFTETGSLDTKGLLTVRIPQNAKEAHLSLVDMKRESPLGQIPLSQRKTGGAQQFSVPLEGLLRKIGRAEDIQVVVEWTPDLNAGRYVNKSNEKVPAKKQTDLLRGQRGGLAKLARFRHEPLLASAIIEGDCVRIVPGRPGTTLAVWAWPLHNPALDPAELVFDGLSATLPDELVKMGPLLLDAKESGFAMFPTPPTRPTNHAVMARQSGYWVSDGGIFDRLSLAFLGNADTDLDNASGFASDPAVMNRLWATTAALTDLSGSIKRTPEVERISGITRAVLRSSPRKALESLGDSTVPRNDKPAEVIRTGLVSLPFTTKKTDEEFHSESWISLLLEIEDIKSLYARGLTNTDEYRKSWRHLGIIGGTQFEETLRTGFSGGDEHAALGRDEIAVLDKNGTSALVVDPPTGAQPWVSANRRKQALAELYNRRDVIEEAGITWQLRRAASRLEGLVMENLQDPAIARILTTQRQKAEEFGTEQKRNWAWVPYISTVHALATRQIAHRVVPRVMTDNDYWQWSQLAGRVPILTVFDLLLAEAVVAHHTIPSLSRK